MSTLRSQALYCRSDGRTGHEPGRVPGKSEKRLETLSCCYHVFPSGKSEVKEGTLFPCRTPCFSLVPVFSQSSSHFHASEPRGEGVSRNEAGRGCSTSEAPHFFLNTVLYVAGDGDSGLPNSYTPSQQLS